MGALVAPSPGEFPLELGEKGDCPDTLQGYEGEFNVSFSSVDPLIEGPRLSHCPD